MIAVQTFEYNQDIKEYAQKGYLRYNGRFAYVFVDKTPPDVLQRLKELDQEIFDAFQTHTMTFLEKKADD